MSPSDLLVEKRKMEGSKTEFERELQNWGRCIHDGWLNDHLGYRSPQTSEEYVPEINVFDDPEPAREPLDEIAAQRTTEIVVQVGLKHFDSYRVLVFWYTRLQQIPDLSLTESINRLSQHMHSSYPGAERMLEQARAHYREFRLQHPKKSV